MTKKKSKKKYHRIFVNYSCSLWLCFTAIASSISLQLSTLLMLLFLLFGSACARWLVCLASAPVIFQCPSARVLLSVASAALLWLSATRKCIYLVVISLFNIVRGRLKSRTRTSIYVWMFCNESCEREKSRCYWCRCCCCYCNII